MIMTGKVPKISVLNICKLFIINLINVRKNYKSVNFFHFGDDYSMTCQFSSKTHVTSNNFECIGLHTDYFNSVIFQKLFSTIKTKLLARFAK